MSRKLNRIFLSVLVISAAVSARTESPTGVLYPAESVYLNGTEIDSSHGLMAGDVIRTRERGTATLQFAGSIALIPPDSVVRLEKGRLAIDMGTISMKTGKTIRPVLPEQLRVSSVPGAAPTVTVVARDLTIVPSSSDATEFDVTRSNRLIVVTAHKNRVTVRCGSHNSNVEEGKRLSRADATACGIALK